MHNRKKIILFFIGSFSFFLCFSQPANNICTSAQVVTPNGTCVNGTTVGATDTWQGTVGCQNGNNGSNHPEVWYSFIATGTQGQFSVTAGAGFTGNIELVIGQG